jgi:uncharacterized protein (DUF2267 family)
MTQVDAFRTTLQKTGEWLRDIRESLDWDSDQRAYQALRAVLHTLRDRLPVAEAVHLGSQLPMLVRGFYYEGWTPTDKPVKMSHDEFLCAVAEHFRNDTGADPVRITRTVIEVLTARTNVGQIAKVSHLMPRDFSDLFQVGAI